MRFKIVCIMTKEIDYYYIYLIQLGVFRTYG
jgi:hypothetical protein